MRGKTLRFESDIVSTRVRSVTLYKSRETALLIHKEVAAYILPAIGHKQNDVASPSVKDSVYKYSALSFKMFSLMI